jgi:membrane-bound metal-dependent hydrolase YbcI (DUF457 family)
MAIGAVASVAATPLILHAPWDTLRQVTLGLSSHGIPGNVVAQVLLVVTAIVGSLLPDLDQRTSLAAREVERLGQVVTFVLMTALLFFMHWQTHWMLWGLVLITSFIIGSNRGITRKIGLAIVGTGLLYLGIRGTIPMLGTFLLAAWSVGAMFTGHRTFTHSLLGSALFIAGVFVVMNALGHVHGVPLSTAAWGLSLGYVLHLVADSVAGGIPLFWPWHERQGVRLVHTGSAMDHALGLVATLAFFGFAIF